MEMLAMHKFTRRHALTLAAAGIARAAAQPVIETHVHLFASDQNRFPFAPDAPYRPSAFPMEEYARLASSIGLAHSIIVQPEPYQDDHRYLEYCFAHEPQPGYFKGTCLFDPFRADTPRRVRALMKQWPNRLLALRIHEMKITTESSGPIRNRDMHDPRMRECWKAVTDMGLAVQMHFVPAQARNIHKLASDMRRTRVILDHMGRPGQGTAEEYEDVLRLADLPEVILKFSGWEYYKGDLGKLTRRIYGSFGPERMIWGTLGNTLDEYRRNSAQFEALLAFAPADARQKIQGGNAQRLFFS
jgi:predicted TIM-barrel fold metal-dependent hydrolase